MSIAKNIKRLRESRDMTQEELAKAIGMSRPAVTQWETGWSQPRMGTIEKLADFFKVSKLEIIGDDTDLNNRLHKATSSEASVVGGMPTGHVPLLGRVHAGNPVEPDTFDGETVLIPQFLIDNDPDCYALEAEGDCMDKVYPEGCIIVVSPNKQPQNGSVAVVSIDGEEYVMRRMYRTPNTLVLSPDSHNDEHKDIVITSDEDHTIEFGGKVVWFQAREEME